MAFPLPAAPQDKRIKIAVVLIGERDLDASIRSLHAQEGCDWIAGALCDDGGPSAFRNEDLGKFLDDDAANCDFVVFALSGTRFEAGALNYLANSFAAFPAAVLAYSDVTILGDHQQEWPVAFPAFDYERMLEQGYGAYFFATKISYAREASAKGVGDLFRLFNMSVDGPILARQSSANANECRMPVHAPGFLARIPRPDLRDGSRLARATEAHLKTRGVSAVTSPAPGALFPAARVQRERLAKRVSILIPTRDRVDLLKPCLASLRRTINLADVEVIVLDNDSSSPDALAFFAELAEAQIRIVSVRGPFNFSRIIGSGVSVASGEFILLLNNDIEALKPGWLEEMLSRIAEPDVGAVGATLLWPSEVVQHGGVVLGVNFGAGHAFSERIDGDPGYGDLLVVARQCSAVTAACLLTRRRLFLDLGGFDKDRFPVNFNDVDYCLRLRARGYRVILTPYAKLTHRESASRGRAARNDSADRAKGELRNLRSAWGEALLSDPFYNPLLSLDEIPFSALAWPPRSMAPRQPLNIQAHALPPGF
jgi:GT2 family glycosyltransferase